MDIFDFSTVKSFARNITESRNDERAMNREFPVFGES